MKRYGNIYKNIYDYRNLYIAAQKAMRGKKNKFEVDKLNLNLENVLLSIKADLEFNTYMPLPYYQFEVRDPKPRIINAPDLRDRVVQHALCNHIEPILDKVMIYDSYACRNDKGLHKALTRVKTTAKSNSYYLKCDIHKYFDSIDHNILIRLLAQKIKDEKVLSLIRKIISSFSINNNKGIPIGSLTSQIFANYYLNIFDHFIKEQLHYKNYVRYMDDDFF